MAADITEEEPKPIEAFRVETAYSEGNSRIRHFTCFRPIAAYGNERRTADENTSDYEQIPLITYGSGFFSWMPYRTVTYRNSRQWQMRQVAVTGHDGIRRYNDLMKVAIGTGWGAWVGCRVTIVLCSGISFDAVVGDIKDDRHTCSMNKVTVSPINNQCVLEFIVCTISFCQEARRMGDMTYMGFEGRVVSIEVWGDDK